MSTRLSEPIRQSMGYEYGIGSGLQMRLNVTCWSDSFQEWCAVYISCLHEARCGRPTARLLFISVCSFGEVGLGSTPVSFDSSIPSRRGPTVISCQHDRT